MKCDPEAAIRRRIAAQLTETLDTQRTTHELMTIIVLHDVFGSGGKRVAIAVCLPLFKSASIMSSIKFVGFAISSIYPP